MFCDHSRKPLVDFVERQMLVELSLTTNRKSLMLFVQMSTTFVHVRAPCRLLAPPTRRSHLAPAWINACERADPPPPQPLGLLPGSFASLWVHRCSCNQCVGEVWFAFGHSLPSYVSLFWATFRFNFARLIKPLGPHLRLNRVNNVIICAYGAPVFKTRTLADCVGPQNSRRGFNLDHLNLHSHLNQLFSP